MDQFIDRNMFFGLQEHFKNLESILEIIDVLLFEQLFKLLFFLKMDMLHQDYRLGPGMS
jgi:hypothetical protein